MFKRLERINSREFTQIFKEGKKYFSSFFRCITSPGKFKVSVVIPKKQLKKRISRNIQKRRIVKVIKAILGNNKPPISVIFFMQKDTTNLSLPELEKELIILMKKTDIL